MYRIPAGGTDNKQGRGWLIAVRPARPFYAALRAPRFAHLAGSVSPSGTDREVRAGKVTKLTG